MDQLQDHINKNLYFQKSELTRRQILSEPRYQEPGRLLAQGFKVYSQGDEDGIIQEIFRRIGSGEKLFCEIGCGDGLQNNTAALLLKGWRGFWWESSNASAMRIQENFRSWIESRTLQLTAEFLTAENIGQSLLKLDVPKRPDFLSLDVDGMEYYLLQALLKTHRPRALAVEYNSKFPPPIDCVVPYDPQFRWDYTDFFGASLTALNRLMNEHSYSLVGCSLTGVNAFFVDNLELKDHFCSPFTPENHYEPARYWLTTGITSGHMAKFGSFLIR